MVHFTCIIDLTKIYGNDKSDNELNDELVSMVNKISNLSKDEPINIIIKGIKDNDNLYNLFTKNDSIRYKNIHYKFI